MTTKCIDSEDSHPAAKNTPQRAGKKSEGRLCQRKETTTTQHVWSLKHKHSLHQKPQTEQLPRVPLIWVCSLLSEPTAFIYITITLCRYRKWLGLHKWLLSLLIDHLIGDKMSQKMSKPKARSFNCLFFCDKCSKTQRYSVQKGINKRRVEHPSFWGTGPEWNVCHFYIINDFKWQWMLMSVYLTSISKSMNWLIISAALLDIDLTRLSSKHQVTLL